MSEADNDVRGELETKLRAELEAVRDLADRRRMPATKGDVDDLLDFLRATNRRIDALSAIIDVLRERAWPTLGVVRTGSH